jgi:hypothetical protein
VFGDESCVDGAPATTLPRSVVEIEERLAHARDRRDVAAVLDLEVMRGNRGLSRCEHLHRRRRIRETHQAALFQRVEGHDRGAALAHLLQQVQHTRAVDADVLAEEEDRIGVRKIIERHGADRHADRQRQRDRRALVAHVGAVRQVVVAVHPGQQLVQVAGLERRPAGGVEDHRLWVARPQSAQLGPDLGIGGFPACLHVLVGGAIPAHRHGQAAGLFEIVITPRLQARQRMAREEFGRRALRGQLPGGGLGAVLAEFGDSRIGGLGPGATHAGETARLVLAHQRVDGRDRAAFAQQVGRYGFQRAPATRRMLIGLEFRRIAHRKLLVSR